MTIKEVLEMSLAALVYLINIPHLGTVLLIVIVPAILYWSLILIPVSFGLIGYFFINLWQLIVPMPKKERIRKLRKERGWED